MHRSIVGPLLLAAALAGAPALAVQSCDLDGVHVNPNNGSTTQGKTGLMRCRDEEGGADVREQELQNGVLLVREETFRDGRTVGRVRSWYPGGTMRRIAFHGDDREQASAEFNEQGQLSELRCAPRPVLGSDFDDTEACGHGAGLSSVGLYGGKGQPRARVAYERGERRRLEQLGDNGNVRELQVSGAASGVERSFAADGVKRKETAWVVEAAVAGRPASERPRRLITLEQEFHESGKLVHEKRWRPGERGSELMSEQHWYLNGQPRDLAEFVVDAGRPLRRETTFHDNGKKASEGGWNVAASGPRINAHAVGAHRSWHADGHLRSERSFDDKGRLTRERELDAGGAVVRDDEVFGDGSRKAYGK